MTQLLALAWEAETGLTRTGEDPNQYEKQVPVRLRSSWRASTRRRQGQALPKLASLATAVAKLIVGKMSLVSRLDRLTKYPGGAGVRLSPMPMCASPGVGDGYDAVVGTGVGGGYWPDGYRRSIKPV